MYTQHALVEKYEHYFLITHTYLKDFRYCIIYLTNKRRQFFVIVSFQFKSIFKDMGGSRAGGGGGAGYPDPLPPADEKTQKYSNTGPDTMKNHKLATFCTMARCFWYFDHLSPHQLKRSCQSCAPSENTF